MTQMLQLNPPLPLETPKGKASAHMVIDYGPQWDLQWVTFIHDTGECWTFLNPEVRQMENQTHHYPEPTPIRPRDMPHRSIPEPAKTRKMKGARNDSLESPPHHRNGATHEDAAL